MEQKLLTLTGIKESRTVSRRNVEKFGHRPTINTGNGMIRDVLVLFITFAKLKVGLNCIMLMAWILLISENLSRPRKELLELFILSHNKESSFIHFTKSQSLPNHMPYSCKKVLC